MSNGFDWQTEDEAEKAWAGWDDPQQPTPPPPKGFNIRSLGRYWRLIAVVSTLSIIAGLVIWRQVSQRAEATMQAIRADVVSSYNLTHTAAASGDEELFRSLLSGRDSGWTQANLFLFQQNQLFDRPQMGLRANPANLPFTLPTEADEQAADQSTVEIELSPDLIQAEVVAVRPFTLLTHEQAAAAEPVLLRQTSLYRRGSQHWLLSPPLNEYWGEWQAIEGERLTVLVPERDLAIGERLAADLDQLLHRACAELADLDCPGAWHITLRLEGDPALLREMAEQSVRPSPNSVIELPAPTLVGLPVEDNEAQAEVGYQALLRGYGDQLLRASIGDLLGYDCCRDVLVFNALVDYQLSQLGLRPWPVNEATYQRVLDERVRQTDLERLWRAADDTLYPYTYTDENWPASLYAFIDYLLGALPDSSPAEMIRHLNDSNNFNTWLEGVLADQPDQETTTLLRAGLDRAWWLAAYQAGSETAAAELPPQALYLICTSLDDPEGTELSTMLSYIPERDEWQEVYRTDGFAWPVLLPGKTRLLLQGFSPAEQQWGLEMWQNGEARPLANWTTQARITFGEIDPGERYLTVYIFNDTLQRIEPMLYDLDACQDGECAITELPGYVRWSPDGENAIYMEADGSIFPTTIAVDNSRWNMTNEFGIVGSASLFLGKSANQDENGLEPIGEGYSPFWISADTYGYIQPFEDSSGDQGIIVGDVASGNKQLLLTTAELEQQLPEASPTGELQIVYVAPHPIHTDLLFIAAVEPRTPANSQIYLFSVERNQPIPILRLQTDFDINHSLGFSPDGRYLVVTGRDNTIATRQEPTAVLLLHEIEGGETTPFLTRQAAFIASHAYDWSADGQWLTFVMADNLVAAVNVNERFARSFVHNEGACTSVAWLDE